ncbi:MAG: hypothetical protein AB7I30_16120 [Isosphaeraceae bacterium]
MTVCAYCERPLICEHCGADYRPPTAAHYQALSRPEVALACPTCEVVLVCHWCKTPYDGLAGDDDVAPDEGR